MASTYVNDLRLEEMATGDQSGTWGDTTNTNLELIAEAFSYGTQASFSSDADATTTIADGVSDPARSLYLKVTSGVSLTATRTLTIAPNTVSKIWIIENATSGSQSISISQGSGANVTIPNGDVKVIYTDGAGSGAAVVDAFTDLNTSGTLTATNLAGTLTTAAQPNITSVGTLTGFTSTGIDDNADATAITIDSSENVGIGTASPSTNLHIGSGSTGTALGVLLSRGATANFFVANDGTKSAYIGVDNTQGFMKMGSLTNHPVSISQGNSNAIYIDTSKNVGIGTTSPSSDISGTATVLEIANSNLATLVLNNTSAASWEIASTVNSDLVFNNGTTRATIDSSGNVGIGTSSPSAALHVVDSSGDAFIKIEATENLSSSDSILRMTTTNTSASAKIQMGDTGDVDTGQIEYDNQDNSMRFQTNAAERMRIDSSGNVGIGTSSPDANLEVEGTISLPLFLSRQVNNVGVGVGVGFRLYDSANNLTNYASIFGSIEDNTDGAEDGRLVFQTLEGNSLTEKMVIDSSGNVGIGTSSPLRNLHIEGTNSDVGLNITKTGTGTARFAYDSTGPYILDQDSNPFRILTGNAERMRIDSSGNVITGSTTANNSAAVTLRQDGTAHVNNVQVANGGGSAGGTTPSIYSPASGTLAISTNSTERIRINGSGNLLVGTTSQINLSTFNFDSAGSRGGIFQNSATAAHTLQVQNTNASYADLGGGMLYINQSGGASVTGFRAISVYANSIARFAVRGDGTIYSSNTTVQSISDERFKENVKNLETGLSEVMNLKPRRFDWKEGRGTNQKNVAGFIAQEIETVLPDLVDEFKDGLEDNEMYKTVGYTGLIPTLVKAIQEQQTQIEALQSEINLLKGE